MAWATAAGLCIATTAVVGLIFYILFIVTVFHPSSQHRTSFFILAGWLGIADCIVLVYMIVYAAPSTIMGQNLGEIEMNGTYTDKRVNAYMGVFVNVGWFTSLPLIVFLAVNRWLCLCHKNWFNVVYSKQKTKCYILAAWIFGIAYSLPSFTDCCPIYFWYDMMSLGWSLDHSGSAALAFGELTITILVATITYLCNGLVIR